MDSYAKSNQIILHDLGQRFRQRRLSLNLTQTALAQQAGIDPGVLRKMEAGKGYTVTAFVALVRALQLLDELLAAIPEPSPSPLMLAKLQGQQRERASGRRAKARA